MDCVNHPGVNATAYCQNCGKAMCAECVRQEPGGQVLCQPCWTAWQSARGPFIEPPLGGPNPVVAGLLGLIPGVGAMYNGQFLKGFIHVAIFAALVSAADHFGIFGLFIAAWILYQAFEAFHTAKARRDGEPLPDPLGLNELAGWFHSGVQAEFRRSQAAAGQAPAQAAEPPGGGPSYVPPYSAPNPYQSGYQPPPFSGMPPGAGYPPGSGYDAGFVPPGAGYPGYPAYPPMPPVPPVHWRRREPVAAIILIALGVLFLLGQWDWFSGRFFEYSWPVLLIALGIWLIFRRVRDVPPYAPSPGATPAGAQPGSTATAGSGERAQDAERESHGGSL